MNATPPPCPTCGKPRDDTYRPFCSSRCANVDLQRWFSGTYAVPAEENDEVADPSSDRAPDA